MNRRQFLATIALSPLLCVQFPRLALAAARWDRTLVLVELDGGNDGLNTVVPFADPLYTRLRPTIGVPRDRVVQLDERLGLAPELAPLLRLWDERRLAIALGVGYPAPNLSHFRGIEIWNQATDSDKFAQSGWVPRLFAEAGAPPEEFTADGISIARGGAGPLHSPDGRVVVLSNGTDGMERGAQVVPTMAGAMAANPALAHLTTVQNNFHHAAGDILERRIADVDAGAAFPETDFGEAMSMAARLLVAGVRTPVMRVALRGFDTHSNQGEDLPPLHAELAESLDAFAQAMERAGLWNDVLVMTYSEFGRRAAENASGGTDHGTAAPHFLLGGRVRGGFYGAYPSLAGRDFPDGRNLAHRLDFRSLYATAAREWWEVDASFLTEPPLGCIT